jgi:amino acid transporter
MSAQPAMDTATSSGSSQFATAPGLRRSGVSLLENFAQTLGVLSPAGTLSIIVPLLIVSAGNGTWLLLFGTLSIFLIVMLSVLRFASLHASAGSLAAFARLGFGRRGGLWGGWVYLLGISYCIPSALLGSAIYLDYLLSPWLGAWNSGIRVGSLTALLGLAAWAAAFRGVKLSTHLMLIIEATSLAVMSILMVIGMSRTHAWVDHAQIGLSGVHFSGLQGGLVVAFMLMAGFEGATSLGEESDNPKSAIPRAIFGCMLPLSVFYLVATYCLVALGNRGVIGGQSSGLTVPFDALAQALRIPGLGIFSTLGVALSYFACALGCLTVAARVLFSMAREGEFWPSFGRTHIRVATPDRAIALISLASIAIPLGMIAFGEDNGTTFNLLVQLGSIGIIGGYLFSAVALPLYLHRRQELRRSDLLVALIASGLLIVVLFLSVYPTPPRPYSFVIYAFLASVLVGMTISVCLRAMGSAQPAESPGGPVTL